MAITKRNVAFCSSNIERLKDHFLAFLNDRGLSGLYELYAKHEIFPQARTLVNKYETEFISTLDERQLSLWHRDSETIRQWTFETIVMNASQKSSMTRPKQTKDRVLNRPVDADVKAVLINDHFQNYNSAGRTGKGEIII